MPSSNRDKFAPPRESRTSPLFVMLAFLALFNANARQDAQMSGAFLIVIDSDTGLANSEELMVRVPS